MKKQKTPNTLLVIGITFVLIGAAAYLVASNLLKDEDVHFDLFDENGKEYL